MAYANHSKPSQQRSGVFISYARSDGEAFAHRLRQQLEKQNVTLWQDRVGMEGGRDWWLQIAEALDKVAFMALVATPNALKSDIVRKEWRYARQQGVCVYPIKGAPNLNFESLPHWMRDQHFYDLGSLEGHSSPMNGCAFSPDGKLIVSASFDRTLKVWDSQTGQMLRSLEGHSQIVRGCVFSPDGKLVVSASWGGTLRVWDSQTGQMLRTLVDHSSLVNGCAFSPDGKLIVSASSDSTLKVWYSETGQTLATFFADGSMFFCAVYGEMIAASGARGVYFLQLIR